MNNAAFFNAIRPAFGGSMTQAQVNGCLSLISLCEAAGWPLKWTAYALATAKWETAHTMQPIAEYGKGKGRKYGVKGKYGQVPYGRGYVQLTWDTGYERADRELGLKGALLRNFDLALTQEIAGRILILGMSQGWFTGKKLSDYINLLRTDYRNARRIINGMDHADDIAAIAMKFEAALKAANYGVKPTAAATTVNVPAAPTVPKPITIPEPTPAKPGFWASVASFLKGKP